MLELSEFQLLASTGRVDAAATLTANIAPAVGSLAALKDASTSSAAKWSSTAGLILSWDFGSGGSADVCDIRLGSAGAVTAFLSQAELQYSDDAANWTTYLWGRDVFTPLGVYSWPGAFALTSSFARGPWSPKYSSLSLVASFDATRTSVILPAPGNGSAMSASVGTTGVRQFEIVASGDGVMVAGVNGTGASSASTVGAGSSSWGRYMSSASQGKVTAGTFSAYGTVMAVGDVLGVVVDFTGASATLTFYKNGVSEGVAFTGLPLALVPAASAAPPANTNNARKSMIRTSGFAYPISGATAWDDATIINTDPALGGFSFQLGGAGEGVQLTTPLSTYGQTVSTQIGRLRDDFLSGVLGAGVGRVRGATQDYALPANLPYPCRVRLVRERDGLPYRELWSESDGSYDFQWVDELQSYTVLAYYAEHGKRAVISDGMTLANGKVELMP